MYSKGSGPNNTDLNLANIDISPRTNDPSLTLGKGAVRQVKEAMSYLDLGHDDTCGTLARSQEEKAPK